MASVSVTFHIQCTVEADDRGYPESNVNEASITVDIERNIELPRFSKDMYEAEVAESDPVNMTVTSISASLSVLSVSGFVACMFVTKQLLTICASSLWQLVIFLCELHEHNRNVMMGLFSCGRVR